MCLRTKSILLLCYCNSRDIQMYDVFTWTFKTCNCLPHRNPVWHILISENIFMLHEGDTYVPYIVYLCLGLSSLAKRSIIMFFLFTWTFVCVLVGDISRSESYILYIPDSIVSIRVITNTKSIIVYLYLLWIKSYIPWLP